jgi:hypothetical protein
MALANIMLSELRNTASRLHSLINIRINLIPTSAMQCWAMPELSLHFESVRKTHHTLRASVPVNSTRWISFSSRTITSISS